jgi:hypothetical protein
LDRRGRAAFVLSLALAGCGGFQPTGGSDASATADLSSPSGGTGPGPLGAIPTGYCCSSSEQCRGRLCGQLGTGPYYCSDFCSDDTPCTGWSTEYRCDVGFGRCVPVNDPYTCIDGASYQYGSKPTGSCCVSDGERAGQDCQGGLCLRVGPLTNPGFCSQGCDTQSPCPSGYGCHLQMDDKGECWPNASLADVNTVYTCG